MLLNENMVDVTLACEGASIKAHKAILAACSPFFHNLFMSNPCKHPIVILKDIRFVDLKSTIDFMYKGEVNVTQDHLSSLLKTAETLKVKGLSDITEHQARKQSNIPDISTCVLRAVASSGVVRKQKHVLLSASGKSKKRRKSRKNLSKTTEVESDVAKSDSDSEMTKTLVNDDENDTTTKKNVM